MTPCISSRMPEPGSVSVPEAPVELTAGQSSAFAASEPRSVVASWPRSEATRAGVASGVPGLPQAVRT